MQRVDHSNYKFLIHLMLCGIGFLGAVFALSCRVIEPYVNSLNGSLLFTGWANNALATSKAVLLPSYMIGIIALFGYVFIATIANNQFQGRMKQLAINKLGSRSLVCFVLASNIVLFLAFVLFKSTFAWVGFCLVWLTVLFFPLRMFHVVLSSMKELVASKKITSALFAGMMLLASVLFLIALAPFFQLTSSKVANDYLWVPEKTYLSEGLVDNNDYIMKNGIGGLHHFSQPLMAEDNRKSDDFILKNKFEFSGQMVAGHFFHHQYAMLGPINELALGKDPSKVVYLYGLGNTQFLAYFLNKVSHPITFENYTATLYSFYLLYFSLFIICCFAIFRDIRYVSITVVAVVGFFLMIGFEPIRIAPGFNPIRHFLDLPLLLSFLSYLYLKRNNLIYLLLALLFALLGVYASKEFGLMMFAALLGAAVFHVIFDSKRYVNLFFLLLGFGALISLWHFEGSVTTQNPMSLYALLGVSVTPTSPKIIFLLFFFVLLTYGALIFIFTRRGGAHKPLYVCLFLFFYSQCLSVYYVWYTEPGHLFAISPIWILLLVMIYRELSSIFLSDTQLKQCAAYLAFGGSWVFLIMGSVSYFPQQLEYMRIFKAHVVYQWGFPRAHFQSTMDPTAFEQATNLVQAYSSSNSIYLISKYDNFLPFLAGKYSAMPYLELSMSLVTDGEVEASSNAILTAKPKYLFVDSDINSTNSGDIVDPMSRLKSAIDKNYFSEGRVSVLSQSKRVFRKVASHYRLIANGYLVSVYEYK